MTPKLGSALLADNVTVEDLESGLESHRTLANVTRKEAFIALNMVPHLGPVRLRRLLDIFGSPDRVLTAERNEFQGVDGLNRALIDSLVSWESVVDLQQELARIQEFGATVLTLDDAEYPALLREIHDPPTVLYIWGKLEARDHHAIGVVGSRRTTHYGLECAKKLSYQIAYSGLTVVSGLARGIDTACPPGRVSCKRPDCRCSGNGTAPFVSRRESSPGRKNRFLRRTGNRVLHGNDPRPSNFPDAESDYQRLGIWPAGGRGRHE